MFFEDNIYLPEELVFEVFNQACGFGRSIMGMCSKKLYERRHSLKAPLYLRERKRIHILEVCCKNNYYELYTYLTSYRDSSLALKPEYNIRSVALRSGSYEICKLMKLPDTSENHYLAFISGNLKCLDLFPKFVATPSMVTNATNLESLDFLTFTNYTLLSTRSLLESIERMRFGLPKETWFQGKSYTITWTSLLTYQNTLANFEEFVIEWYRLYYFNTTVGRFVNLGITLKSKKMIDSVLEFELSREQQRQCVLTDFLYPINKEAGKELVPENVREEIVSRLTSYELDSFFREVIKYDNVELFKVCVSRWNYSKTIICAEVAQYFNAYEIGKYLLTESTEEYLEEMADCSFRSGRISLCKLCLERGIYKVSAYPEVQKLVEVYKTKLE